MGCLKQNTGLQISLSLYLALVNLARADICIYIYSTWHQNKKEKLVVINSHFKLETSPVELGHLTHAGEYSTYIDGQRRGKHDHRPAEDVFFHPAGRKRSN